jgi:hypothetical protein
VGIFSHEVKGLVSTEENSDKGSIFPRKINSPQKRKGGLGFFTIDGVEYNRAAGVDSKTHNRGIGCTG